MKAIKKIFNVDEYLKSQGKAKQHIANVSKNKGDRKQVPHLKAQKIALNQKQHNIIQSWYPKPVKAGVGYTTRKKQMS